MSGNFNTPDRLTEICALIDKLAVEYEVHRRDEEEYSYLDEYSACVTVYAVDSDRTIFIDSECGLEFNFGQKHTSIHERSFSAFAETLTAVLKSELCVASLYVGEDRMWLSDGLRTRSEIGEKSVVELFIAPPFVEEYKVILEENGAKAEFLFWDSNYDRTVIIENKIICLNSE